jgi:geranylgeranyl diphosphate synthase type I
LVGTREATKKDFRSDITEGKRTLVAVHALQHSPKRERLLAILSAHETDTAVLDEAVGIMQEAGSIDYANGHAQRLVLDAKSALEAELPKTKARGMLASMADFFIKRSS